MEELTKLKQKLMQIHPNWPQDKANWMAMQALGLIPNKR